MNNMNVKLILAFIVILMLPAISIGTLSYTTAKDAVEKEILHGIEQSMNLLDASIDNTLQPKIHDIEYFSESTIFQNYQDEKDR